MINFGTVVELESKHYVYFIEIDQYVYLAKIIAGELAEEAIQLRASREKKSSKGSLNSQKSLGENIVYSFVILTTEQYKDCIAFCQNPPISSSKFKIINERVVLNEKDIANLIEEIKEGDYPIGLQEYVNTLSK